MAVTYVMTKFAQQTITVSGSYSWTVNGGSSVVSAGNLTQEGYADITVPTISGSTPTEAYFYFTTSSPNPTTMAANCSSRSSSYAIYWDTVTTQRLNYGTSNRAASTVPAAGTTVRVRYSCVLQGVQWYPGVASTSSISCTFTLNCWMRLKITLPTISDKILESEVNKLAGILNATAVTQNSKITKTTPQNLCSYATSKVYLTYNQAASGGSTHPAAITFDTTKPLKANMTSVITNLTSHFVYR